MILRLTVLLFGCSALPFVALGQAPAKPAPRTIITPAGRVKPGVPPKSIRRLPTKGAIPAPARIQIGNAHV